MTPSGTRSLPGLLGRVKVWAALGHNGGFPHDIDVVLVGSPDRDDATEALVNALSQLGQDVQVVFRSPRSWGEEQDAFTRTAKPGPLVELQLTEPT